ncbi:MAG: DUF4435 domain-containing protein [Alkalinema sp. RU_4_3]|nr:DUF4435 domain-containing protein [Alkalinema sp. RU_4_3]
MEGSSDARFYRQQIDADHCQIVVAQNRDMALKVLGILQKDPAPDVIAIVDKDFDELDGTLPDLPNLFFTDTHDLETLLLQSPALDKLLNEFASEDKLARFGQNLREMLLISGSMIGYLRWISKQDAMGLTFEGIDFPKFVGDLMLKTNEVQLIEEVKNKSQRPGINTAGLQERLKQQKNDSHDLWQICCGHDLISILSVGLRRAIGSRKPNDITPDILERSLRLAYEQVYFQKTQLYGAIALWQTNHPTYQIFP